MTFHQMLMAWNERDNRYGYRKVNGVHTALSEAEQSAVRSWRRHEAMDLDDENERTMALLELARWVAPKTTRF